LLEELVDMGDDVSSQHNLEHIGRQIVMEEQGSVKEKVGHVVEQISREEDLSNSIILLKFFLANVITLTPTAQKIQDQQTCIDSGAGSSRVPDYNIAEQMNLVVRGFTDVIGNTTC
jgi:hypothetical protein